MFTADAGRRATLRARLAMERRAVSVAVNILDSSLDVLDLALDARPVLVGLTERLCCRLDTIPNGARARAAYAKEHVR